MKRIYDLRAYIYLASISLVITLISIFSYLRISDNNKQQFFDQQNSSYETKIYLAIDYFDEFSEYLFYKLIDEEVTQFMYQAVNGEIEDRDFIRESLYTYLLDDYNLITEYHFRQLHFHLPNGDSFLRMHAPETFGDNLFDIRKSIKQANTEERVVKGFEEGRIFNGYRFVYPVYHMDQHVGSVEISISIGTVLEMLYKQESENAHFFMILRSVIDDIVFDDYLSNYQQSFLSSQYAYDQSLVGQFEGYRSIFTETDDLFNFFAEVSPEVSPKMDTGESFHLTKRHNNIQYTFQFVSLENINAQHVGYIFTLFIDDEYPVIILRDRFFVSSMILFSLIIFFGAVIYIKGKRKYVVLSRTDVLTQLSNRQVFNDIVEKEIDRIKKSKDTLSLIVMDIDFFKKINDKYGHLVGDAVLKKLASILQGFARPKDVLCRWGGEEFAFLMPSTSKDEAYNIAKKVQDKIKETNFFIDEQLTLSYGISSTNEDIQSVDQLFKVADDRLYQAKETGRNKIVY